MSGGGRHAIKLALAIAALGSAPLAVRAADDLRVVVQADPNAQEIEEKAAISTDGRYVAAIGTTTGIIVIWDVASGNIVDTIPLPDAWFSEANLNPVHTLGTPQISANDACILVDFSYDLPGTQTVMQERFTFTLADATWQRAVIAAGQSAPVPAACRRKPGTPAPDATRRRVEILSAGNMYGTIGNAGQNLGLGVTGANGRMLQNLDKRIKDRLVAAALSPDARYLATVNSGDLVTKTVGTSVIPIVLATTIAIFDLTSASFLDPITVKADSNIFVARLDWRDATHLVLSWAPPQHMMAAGAGVPDLHVFDISTRPVGDVTIPGRCLAAPLADGSFVGARTGNCVEGASAAEAPLWRYTKATGWQPLDPTEMATRTVDALAAAPDGQTLAVVSIATNSFPVTETLQLLDLGSGHIRAAKTVYGMNPASLGFLPDGRLLVGTGDDINISANWLWDPATGAQHKLGSGVFNAADYRLFSDGTSVLAGQLQGFSRTDLASGTVRPALRIGGSVINGGFSADRTLFWAASDTQGVHVWHTADWSPAMSVYLLAGQHYYALAPSGRYDTNLGPDTNAFRWLVRDAPLQSLAPQTFMRDYFAPRLTAGVLDGSEAKEPIRPILSLDRVLPQVRITQVAAGPTADTALVSLTVRESVDPHAANGRTRSGINNLRLFRDNALIAEWPRTAVAANDDTVASWQRDNALKPGPDGLVHASYLAHLPTAATARTVHFSAYAFNADRIKSDTVSQAYTRPVIPPRPARAYVLTVGINSYREPRLQLQFAANDARLLAQRLSSLPGHEVRQVVLAGTPQAKPVVKAVIAAALDLLAGGDRTADLAILAAAGSDGSPFSTVTPDDLVIVAFSGHGWADPHGNFYLLAADAAWPDSSPTPDRTTLISAGEITRMFRGIDAGALALVIDACHSAASVATRGFKPGPMGDPGLGQLAYDKGIRILAATQSDDIAMEDAALKQGLLTYALAGEGIDGDGSKGGGFGKADLNSDGRIMLDEWLRYALRRMPALSTNEHLRHFGNSSGGGFAGAQHVTIISDTQALPPKPQDPALFDFNAAPSAVALREKKS